MSIKTYIGIEVEAVEGNTMYVWGYWNKVNYDLIALELSDFAPLLEQYDDDTMKLDVSPRIDSNGRLILLTTTIKASKTTKADVTIYLDGFDQHDPGRTKFAATMTVNGDPVFADTNPMTESLYGGLSTAAILNLMLEGMTLGYSDTDDDFFAGNAIPSSWADDKHRHRLCLASFCGDIAEHFELW